MKILIIKADHILPKKELDSIRGEIIEQLKIGVVMIPPGFDYEVVENLEEIEQKIINDIVEALMQEIRENSGASLAEYRAGIHKAIEIVAEGGKNENRKQN